MFYEQESIDAKLKCLMCMKRLQEPVFLPCGVFVCEGCIEKYVEEKRRAGLGQFECRVCNENHDIPAQNGFKKSITMRELLEAEPKQVNKGDQIEKFKADIDQCFKGIRETMSSLESKEKDVKDYFELRRKQIERVAKRKIETIVERSKELLDQMDRFEAENLESFTNQQPQKEIEDDLKRVGEFCKK